MKSAAIERKPAWFMLIALVVISPCAAPAPIPGALPEAAGASAPFNKPLAKIWHSETTKKDFQVQVTNDLFRAEWVNIPPAAAKQGVYIRTECRRSGVKWVGTSTVNMQVAIPGAPPGKDTKVCTFTVRFEVDSLNSLKITGHTDSLKNFDVKTCHVQQTSWVEFTWVPKQK